MLILSAVDYKLIIYLTNKEAWAVYYTVIKQDWHLAFENTKEM